MNQPSTETLDQAFTALAVYKTGSGRAALLPIDQAVSAGLPGNLETRLLAVLDKSPSDPAREYIFSKLAQIGTLKSLPVLAKAAASELPSATTALTALGNLTAPEATRALTLLLPQSSSKARVALLNSLGVRRDPEAAPIIAKLLTADESSPAVFEAAIAALGQIASPKAAKALKQFHPRAPQALRATVADSILVCADGLLAKGDRNQARELYALLSEAWQPVYVREASSRGLKACS
jgi:HEAT repeat protein